MYYARIRMIFQGILILVFPCQASNSRAFLPPDFHLAHISNIFPSTLAVQYRAHCWLRSDLLTSRYRVRLSHYRPGQAFRAARGSGFQYFYILGT